MLLADMEEKGKILNAEENDFMMDTDDEGELLETNMVYMASLEKVDVFEAHDGDSTPSYDTDAEDGDTLGNKVHIFDDCDNDDLDEFIHGHISTTSMTTQVNTSSATSTSATPTLSANSTNSNHVSTSQDHVDMLQNYATIQTQITNYANLIKLEQDKSASLEKKIKDMLYEEKSERPLVLKRQIQDLQDEIFSLKRNITSFENGKKNLENEVSKLKDEKANCIQRLTKAELKIRTTGQTPQTMHMYLPKSDPILDLRPGLGFSNPSYLEMVKRKAPSLYNSDYMRRDTFKDYMFVPNDISNEENQKRLMVKQKKTNFSYFSADYGVINKENALERKPTNAMKHVDVPTVNPYHSSNYESLARKTFCHLRNQISSSLRTIREKQEFTTDELVRSNSYEIDVSREVKKQIKLFIEPPVKSIDDKLKVFEETLMTEMQNDLKYVTSLEDEYGLICLNSNIQKEYFSKSIRVNQTSIRTK